MKKAFTLIELLAVIVILAVISVIAYPKVVDLIGVTKINSYNVAKKNIIKSAKIKYLADVNSAVVKEYSVPDLIKQGYINEDTKNPLTNEKYDDKTKVLVTNEDGKVTFDYIEGNTLYELINSKGVSDGIYKEENDYIYKGINSKNYISFNGEIYRIIKIDMYRNIYVLKDENSKQISKENINEYVESYYNDNYNEITKKKIKSVDLLDYEEYKKTFISNESFVENKSDIWVKNNGEYKSLSVSNNNLNNSDKASIRLVIKLGNNNIVSSGIGTQLDPYIIEQ